VPPSILTLPLTVKLDKVPSEPLTLSVAPLGIVIVSPESPTVNVVPDCGIILSTSTLIRRSPKLIQLH
jgi:hypothetical protein